MEIAPMQASRMHLLISFLLLPLPTLAQVIEPGLYEVSVSVRIPNVRVTNADFVTRICWRDALDTSMPLGPLGPGPLRSCPATARRSGAQMIVDTQCEGPNAGWAVSSYRSTAGGFSGAVEINLGGKNMTVRELQRGVRVGACPDQ